jgi:biopolymer transport protein ExbB/TolQ
MLVKTSFIFMLYLITMILIPLITGGAHFIEEFVPAFINIELIKQWNQPSYGVLHIPSLVFIGLSYLVLARVASITPKSQIDVFFSQVSDVETFFNKAFQDTNRVTDNTELYRNFDITRKASDLKARMLQLIYHGGSDADVTRLLEIESSQYRQSAAAKIKNTGFAATLLPLLGMAGTITGLMFIFSGDLQAAGSAEESFNQKFAGMGIALLTTLYATILTSLLAKPSQHGQQSKLSRVLIDIERAENYVLMFKHSVNHSEWVMYTRNTELKGDSATLNQEQISADQNELRGAA